MWTVSVCFFKQGWLKEALTEGEFYLMNFFPLISLSQQGIYQVNYLRDSHNKGVLGEIA